MDDNEQKIKVSDCQQQGSIFKKVPASELRLDDEFMQYEPETVQEKVLMEKVKEVIETGVRDFWRPVCDPSFNDDGYIGYYFGKKPAVGKSYIWWKRVAKEFCLERNSRLGNHLEYFAFLAVLIKELVASGKSVEWAWNAVCNHSKELGHYCDSVDSKNGFEPTGSREICGWCDLANASKILAEDEGSRGFSSVSGDYECSSFCNPLASLWYRWADYCRFDDNCFSVGWIVFDSCPD